MMSRVLLFALSLGASTLAAQVTPPPLTCTARAAGTPIIRAEGLTELVGDVLITCTGGQPTPAGQPLPQVNIQLTTVPPVSITSRITGQPPGNLTEALLFIDEPSPQNQTLCGSTAFPYSVPPGSNLLITPGVCGAITGSPSGNGLGTYLPNVPAPPGTYRGNVFQARQEAANRLVWQGVPFDPPGTIPTRVFRITNVRANASQLPAGNIDHSFPIQLHISTATSTPVPLTNPNPIVAQARNSLDFSVRDATHAFQCEDFNSIFATNSTGAASPPGGAIIKEFTPIFTELHPNAFRRRNQAVPTGNPLTLINPPPPVNQDSFDFPFQFESGFMKAASSDRWPGPSPSSGNRIIGLAGHGTRLLARFNNIQNGVQVWAPRVVASGSTVALLETSIPGTPGYVLLSQFKNNAGENTAEATYEILNSDPAAIETLAIRTAYAWTANAGANLPALGTSSITGAYASPLTWSAGRPFGQVPNYPDLAPYSPATHADQIIPAFFDNFAAAPGLRAHASLTIADCANRSLVRPRLAVTTGALPVVYHQQGNLPDPFQLYVLADGASISGITADTSTPWIHIDKIGDTTPVTLKFTLGPASLSLPPGNHTGSIRISGSGIPTATVPVPLTVNPPGPHFTRSGVTNTASYVNLVLSTGAVLTIFGERFGPDSLTTAVLESGKLATTLGGTRVLFDGAPAPMLYAVNGQLSTIAPFSLQGKPFTVIQIEHNGVKSPGVRIPVAPAVPGLLTANSSGSGPAAALNEDNTFNSISGELPGRYVVFFGVGGPATNPPGRDGEITTAPLPVFTTPVKVLLDGVEVPAADVAYVGPAPGLAQGVWQANVRLPANAPRGRPMQVRLQFGDYITQPGVTVAVR